MSIKTFKLCLTIFFSFGVVRSMESRPKMFLNGKMYEIYTPKSENIHFKIMIEQQRDLINDQQKFNFLYSIEAEVNNCFNIFIQNNLNLTNYTIKVLDFNIKRFNIQFNKNPNLISPILKSHIQNELKIFLNFYNNINSMIKSVNMIKLKQPELANETITFINQIIKNRYYKFDEINKKIFCTINNYLMLYGYALLIDPNHFWTVITITDINHIQLYSNYLMTCGYQLLIDQNNFLMVTPTPKTNYNSYLQKSIESPSTAQSNNPNNNTKNCKPQYQRKDYK